MKYIIIILAFLPLLGLSQTKTLLPVTGSRNTIAHQADSWFPDSVMLLPAGCGTPTINMTPYMAQVRKGAVALDTCNHLWFGWDPSLSTWRPLSGSLPSDTAHINFGFGLTYSATPYSPTGSDINLGADTSILALKSQLVSLNFIDSSDINYFVDSAVTAPFSAPNGHEYLIIATATGLFAGKENQIATRVGSGWSYSDADKQTISFK